ncbi:MAG: restriction endonuclease subunit S [Rhodobacteraceae bacterium]|nr:restriction endonuclease subunit S [Paracoccaceae bacterium]MCF8515912.1 restriction endonuclease subunit S [Paracoccaceae bacterium]MCF8520319.1 restriction endonuclease subunit S [Paracoccaceae bacterium]
MITPIDALTLEPPKTWRVQPFWSLFRREKQTGFPDEELLSVYRDHGVVPTASRDDNNNKPSEDLSGYQLVTEGALVTNKMKAWQGSISISRHRGIVSPAYYVYQPLSGEHDQFLHYLLRSEPYIALYQRISKGVRVNQWDLEHEALRTIPVLLPDFPTQKRIAAFLDRETARIDELIAKKERLGGVIDQRRLAVITAAVAGKIGPAAETTAAQSVTKREIRLRFMLQVAPSAREIENLTAEDEVTFAPMDALDDGLGGLDASMSRPLGEVAAGSYNYFREGDVLLAKVTPCFENGKKALARGLINGVGFATSEVHVFRPTPGKLDARFLMYLFSSEDFRSDGMKSMTGAGGLKRVSDSAILNYRPHIVDIDLQRKVADFLDREMGIFEVIKGRTRASIDRLREYRAALITAAVTGQIDVDTYGKAGNTSAGLDRIEELAE